MNRLKAALLVSCFYSPSIAASKNDRVERTRPQPTAAFKIGFFNPSSPWNTYWPQVFFAIEQVAHDLGFQFLHYDLGADDRMAGEIEIKRVLSSDVKLDAIMSSTTINGAKRILAHTQIRKIPVIFEGPLFPQEMRALGLDAKTIRPDYWLGTWHQNEIENGYQLAKLLIARARAKRAFASDGKIQILAVGGTRSWFGSHMREAGLKKAVAEEKDAVILQIIPSDWTTEKSLLLSTKMLERFPEASVIWATSDQTAVGAAQALKKAGKVLGKNAFTGGIDFSAKGLEMVKSGEFETTVGTPLSYYAKIAVYLYDYISKAYSPNRSPPNLVGEVYVATKDNLQEYSLANQVVAELDFKDFSMKYRPELLDYDFTWPKLLQTACKKTSFKNESVRLFCAKSKNLR